MSNNKYPREPFIEEILLEVKDSTAFTDPDTIVDILPVMHMNISSVDKANYKVVLSIDITKPVEGKDVPLEMECLCSCYMYEPHFSTRSQRVNKRIYCSIPKKLYSFAKERVEYMAKCSGANIRLPLYKDAVIGGPTISIEEPVEATEMPELIDYKWLMSRVEKFDKDCINFYRMKCGDPFTSFELQAVYRYYYKFFTPTSTINLPFLLDIDVTVWDMMYRLLMGDPDTTCQLIDTGDTTEVIFSMTVYDDDKYIEFNKRELSSITKEEAVAISTQLLINAYFRIGLAIIVRVDFEEDYPFNCDTVTEEKFADAYRFRVGLDPGTDEIFDKMVRKIVSYPYISFNG